MTGVLESLVPDMHASQISAGGYQQQQQQQQHGGLHKPQESPTLPVSTATDSSYYTNQQHGAAGGPPYGPLGSYPYAAGGAAPYSAKAGYDLGYAGAYGSYGPYGARASPASNDPGTSEPRGGPAGARPEAPPVAPLQGLPPSEPPPRGMPTPRRCRWERSGTKGGCCPAPRCPPLPPAPRQAECSPRTLRQKGGGRGEPGGAACA
nr:homeobox protein DLX-2 [Anser cygnoides]